MGAPSYITKQNLDWIAWDRVDLLPGRKLGVSNPIQSRNQTRQPQWFRGITFMTTYPLNLFGFVSARIRIGANCPITRDYHPVWALGAVYNRQLLPNMFKDPSVQNLSWQQNWRFPQPMWLDPQDDVIIELKIDDDHLADLTSILSGTPAMSIYTALDCVSMPTDTPPPNTVNVPWAAYWRTPDVVFGTVNEFVSTLDDLQNPWEQKMQVEKFVGRIMVKGLDAYEGYNPRAKLFANNVGILQPDIYQQLTTLRLKDHDGRVIIRDKAPYSQVISSADNCWWVNAQLNAKSFYVAKLEMDTRLYPTGWPGEGSGRTTTWVDLSCQGYRNVRIR